MNSIFDCLFISSPNQGGLFFIKNNEVFKLDNLNTTGLYIKKKQILRAIQPRDLFICNDILKINKSISLFDDIHDVFIDNDDIYVVETANNKIVKLNSHGEELMNWVFPGESDSFHINCLASWNGRLVFSAFGNFTEHRGYKGRTEKSGFVQDLYTGNRLINDLSQPHSLVPFGKNILLANSEKKELSEYDFSGNKIRTLVFDKYTRGICIFENVIYLGLSCSRNIEDISVRQADIVALDSNSWAELGRISIPASEIYTIQCLAGHHDDVIDVLASITSTAFLKLLSERDEMLRGKDAAWSIRLEQCSHDYKAEISRVASEHDLMLNSNDIFASIKFDNVAPRVSVVIVNFNGQQFLYDLLVSLSSQTFQPEEIIVVDNCSSDDSILFIKKKFPFVKIVKSEKNIGFAGGNNLGVRSANYPLVALINNDTVVESTWLEHLVRTWVKRTAHGEKIGAVSPKIRFFRKFLSFRFDFELFSPGENDERFLGVAIDFSKTRIKDVTYVKPIAVSGFHHEELWPDGRTVRWTSGSAELMLPIEESISNPSKILCIVLKTGENLTDKYLEVKCDGCSLGLHRVTNEFAELEIEIPRSLLDSSNWVINNAGSRLDRYGNASDIGINQPDHGQFDNISDIEAFCGCSVLIPRKTFLNLGGFDDKFFMYYEDVDLSWRMRLNDLKIIFEPRSVVRHIHAGSSGEWSPGFRYHVTRNYRLNGFKNAHLPQLLILIMRFMFAFGRSLRVAGFGVWSRRSSMNLQTMSPVEIEFKALLDAFTWIPGILIRRMLSLWKKRETQ